MWKQIWNILEGSFHLVLVNARPVKNVQRRKADMKNAEWLAKHLICGLIESNFAHWGYS